MTDLNIENYSDKSIVVRGDTKKYKEQLKKLFIELHQKNENEFVQI